MIYKFLFEALLLVILVVVYHYLYFKLIDKVEEVVNPYGTEVIKKVEKYIRQAQWLIVLFSIFYIIITQYDTWAEPRAIDVYRGQTKLEINYENDVPQDTIIVWKNNTSSL